MRKFVALALVSGALAGGFTGLASAAIGVRDTDPRFIVVESDIKPPPAIFVYPPPLPPPPVNLPRTSVPEPATLGLLGLGALGVGLFKRRK